MKPPKNSSAWLYCYLNGNRAVFLNRWDERIKTFDTYQEAEEYALNNMHLIDFKVTDAQPEHLINQI